MKATDPRPGRATKILLCGETHGEKEQYDIELALWQDHYAAGCRALFLELAYYSAAFLNVWMQEDTDAMLDIWFGEIHGTLAANDFYYAFLQEIKASCPETVFYGTDVGHQYATTGARYLTYLSEHGMQDSEEYRLASACIQQGQAYYADGDRHDGISDVQEAYMVANFHAAYRRAGGGRILGIYGSYHTDLSAPTRMAGQLRAVYGDALRSVPISSLLIAPQDLDA